MSAVRRAALRALGDQLITALDGVVESHAVHVEAEDSDKPVCYPAISIDTRGAFEFEPFDADEVDTGQPDKMTVHVGDFVGQVMIEVISRTRAERLAIGDLILNEFLKTQGKSGVLVLQLSGLVVGGVTLAVDVPIAFRLDSTAWEEEMVFDRKRSQTLTVGVEIPALVTWLETYDITSLVVAFTGDLTSEVPDLTYTEVQVTDAGDLEAFP